MPPTRDNMTYQGNFAIFKELPKYLISTALDMGRE